MSIFAIFRRIPTSGVTKRCVDLNSAFIYTVLTKLYCSHTVGYRTAKYQQLRAKLFYLGSQKYSKPIF